MCLKVEKEYTLMVYPNKQKNQKNIQQETIEKTPIYTKQNKKSSELLKWFSKFI